MPESNPLDEFDSLSGAPVPGIDETPDSATLRQELDRMRGQVEEQRALYLRALADFDNYKKRMQRDQRALSDLGRRDLLKRILPVLDSLLRAQGSAKERGESGPLVDGLDAIIKQFESSLEAEQVRPIDTVGKPFDPTVSEAVGTAADGSAPDNTVIAEARRGYVVGDEILRPAQVIVSKHTD